MPKSNLRYLVAAMAVALPMPLTAGPPVSLPTVPNIARVSPSDDSGTLSRSGGLLNDWRFRQNWSSEFALSYDSALRFASCVSRFNPAAPSAVLAHDLGALQHRSSLTRLASNHRPCVSEAGLINPFLLRVAFAEVGLRSSGDFPRNAVLGVPAVVDNYPLAQVSNCHAALSPDRVNQLFATRPGSFEERQLADQLYRSHPQCGTRDGLGRVEATVARLSLLDAVVTSNGDKRP